MTQQTTVPLETPSESGALASRPAAQIIEGRLAAVVELEAVEVRPKRRVLPLVLVSIVGVASATAAGWFLAPLSVNVTTPSRGPAVEAVYATGTVEAHVTIAIAAAVSGRIAEVLAEERTQVTKGQLLVRFEDETASESVRQYSALEVFAEQEFHRIAKLLDRGAVSQSVYDRARSDWLAAKAATARAAAEAKYLRLTAPTDGHIVKRDAEIGQVVAANQAMLWLAQNDPLRVSIAIDEEDIAKVQTGQRVLVRSDAFPGKIFHGRVQSTTPMGDFVAHSYRVRVEMNEVTPFLIGMTVEANILISERADALLVPTSAIDKDRLWRVIDGKLAPTQVTLGVRGAARTEVIEGLSLNDVFVVAPQSGFAAGDRVKSVPVQSK